MLQLSDFLTIKIGRRKLRKKEVTALVSLVLLAVVSLVQVFVNRSVLGESVDLDDRVQGNDGAVVSRVIDGDTIELQDGTKVRYLGVDTPETVHPTKKDGCFGEEAKKANERLVLGQTVRLERDVSETDRYGRVLAYVWVGETMINQVLVEEGFAFARSFPPDIKHQEALKTAERQAREENRGLWGVCELNDVEALNEMIDEVELR